MIAEGYFIQIIADLHLTPKGKRFIETITTWYFIETITTWYFIETITTWYFIQLIDNLAD